MSKVRTQPVGRRQFVARGAAAARDFKDRLIFERREHGVAEVIEKKSFDQIMHGPAAAAVRERDEFVFDSRFSSTRAFDAFKEWRGA